jgi:hypothetical protein
MQGAKSVSVGILKLTLKTENYGFSYGPGQ